MERTETGADYLAVHVGLGTAVTDGIMTALLVAALVLQLRMRRYVPWIYWLTVVLVSIVGTQITDFLTDDLEISLYASTAAFAAVLAATFAIWYAVEKTLTQQTVVSTELADQDVLGLYRQDDVVEVVVLFMRQGKLIGLMRKY